MRQGPEHAPGWRARYETVAGTVTVSANHHSRRRMPRGHEMARQAMSGRPFDTVPETSHEWHMTLREGNRRALVRVHPNGRFHTHDLHRAYDSIEALAMAWGERIASCRPAVPRDEPEPAPDPFRP